MSLNFFGSLSFGVGQPNCHVKGEDGIENSPRSESVCTKIFLERKAKV